MIASEVADRIAGAAFRASDIAAHVRSWKIPRA